MERSPEGEVDDVMYGLPFQMRAGLAPAEMLALRAEQFSRDEVLASIHSAVTNSLTIVLVQYSSDTAWYSTESRARSPRVGQHTSISAHLSVYLWPEGTLVAYGDLAGEDHPKQITFSPEGNPNMPGGDSGLVVRTLGITGDLVQTLKVIYEGRCGTDARFALQ
jgi:hypothetical protein